MKKFCESIRYGRVRLYKRADNGFWYAKYRLPDAPRWVEKSLQTAVRKDAEKVADHLNARILSKTLGVADDFVPISILFEKYFAAMDGHISSESVKRFMSTRHMLERWLEDAHPEIRLVKHLRPSLVREFQRWRVVEQGVSKRTADNDVTALHTIFRWGEREGLVEKSPFNYSAQNGAVQLFDEPQRDRDTYTEEEHRLLVLEAERTGDRLIRDMIIVLADTGLRFGELANLTPQSLCWNHEPPYIDIRSRNGWNPKDPKEIKQIPMAEVVAEVLRRRAAKAKGKNSLLFTNDAGNLIAENHTRERLKKLFPAVGIDPCRRLHWHSWRNHFVIRCLEAGIPAHHVMQWTGHDSVAMVMHYAQVISKDRIGAAEFRKMPSRQVLP